MQRSGNIANVTVSQSGNFLMLRIPTVNGPHTYLNHMPFTRAGITERLSKVHVHHYVKFVVEHPTHECWRADFTDDIHCRRGLAWYPSLSTMLFTDQIS